MNGPRSRGGYHPDSRLETTRDEILMEALTGAIDPRADVQRLAFDEIARLGRKYLELLRNINDGMQPPLALAGA